MVEISPLTGADRARWEVLARAGDTHFGTTRPDDDYERTWHRLLDDGQPRGVAARLDGTIVGVAHYVFHAGIWGSDRCYLADLFVDPAARRQGVATAIIDWLAQDADRHGFPRLYWNTLVDAPARALYDKVGTFNEGLILYTHRPVSESTEDQRSASDEPSGPLV
ncbi:GNAT family N-acetyltransferase [Actinokineospora globicatena]|uniref:GNAT family N-acetyltransferase n=1 Tax=Actinokineospora globicatena TaxID=103729 RepID=UPI0020A3ADA6|nr:GNAT family N-acetyltransferase [Actinokineospora globicatena]MCP2303946.1 Ribosomal protein S18 acetylase RimI [Actinokineospora globicatena]GLW78892.1 N-acetyltransferase [Actinokineospora globicatena]GLW86695.1 N-acetyltransferase [Actinokineospora globicatena]